MISRAAFVAAMIGALSAVAAILLPAPANAAVPAGFTNEIIAGGFTNPVSAVFDPPTNRMFVVEKRGSVRVHKNGAVLPDPLLDLVDEVHDAGDKGMLSLALDPDFSNNGYFYVLYAVDPVEGQPDEPADAIVFGRLTRYTAIGDMADPGSRLVLLGSTAADGLPSCAITHSIGTVRFGLDGTLLLSAGDGAHPEFTDGGQNILANDALCDSTFGPAQNLGALRSQSLDSMAGKILRLDPATGFGLPSNPFWNGDPQSFTSRVWARGLRNPFRFTVRPGSPPPGTLYVCDVGWHNWEEVNVVQAGDNLGWPCWEGVPVQNGYYYDEPMTWPACQAIDSTTVRPPLFSYHHSNPNPIGFVGNAATGAVFYTGTSYPPQYHGRLFFADLGQHWIKVATVDANDALVDISSFATSMNFPVELSVHPENGDIVYVTIAEGRVRRIRSVSANFPPNAAAEATPNAGSPPLHVQFSSTGTNDPNGDPLTFVWNFGDGSPESNAPNPTHTYISAGTFPARLIVSDPGGLADTALVTVETSNLAPTVSIVNPVHGFVFEPGTPILFSADAFDPESGANLGWNWSVTLIHNEHYHPGWFNSTEMSPLFVPADHGGPGDRVSYRIAVFVTDPGGLAAGDSVVIVPPSLGKNADPIAQFVASRYEGEAPLAVTFDASDSEDPDQDLLDFRWRFGDGTVATGASVEHYFGSYGLYTVTLVAEDPFLGSDSTTCAIRVEPPGLLASWNFDEGAGTSADDATAFARDGSFTGSGYEWIAGVRGGAVDFLGTNSEMTTGQSFLSGRSAFTLAAWIRPRTTGSHFGIVGQNDAIEMGFDSPGIFDIWTPGGGEVLAPYSFSMGEWRHVAASGSGSALRVYYDGIETASGNFATGNYGTSAYAVKVGGGIFDPGGGAFDGTLDDVRIWGRALSPQEVAFVAAPPPPNAAPALDAGLDVTTPVGVPVVLLGICNDDGLPAPPGRVTTTWSQSSGPVAASIFDPARRRTLVTFPQEGTYVLAFEGTDGELSNFDEIVVTVVVATTGGSGPGPDVLDGLRAVGPNPIRGAGSIRFGVAREGARIELSVHDVVGRRVSTLAAGPHARGEHSAAWNGRDQEGGSVAAGIYFVVLDVDGRRFTKKLALLR